MEGKPVDEDQPTSSHATCGCHRHHHLNCEQYDALLAEADGCQICGFPPDRMPLGRLYIDHSGQYGSWRVRGLLCISCNSRLREDNAFSPAARSYLANAWYLRQCQLAGVPITGGPEPAVDLITDNFRRVWQRRGGCWL